VLPWSRNATKTWFRCQRLIGSLVARYCKFYTLDRDEAWSAAALGFCKAFDTFERRRRVKIKTWVYWKVQGALEDLRVQKAREAKRPEVNAGDHDFGAGKPPDFDPTRLYNRLNLKGIQVVKWILKPPRMMRRRMRELEVLPDDHAGIRRVLTWYLRCKGWSDFKIKKVFNHIKRTL
jgi:hypothetical protein